MAAVGRRAASRCAASPSRGAASWFLVCGVLVPCLASAFGLGACVRPGAVSQSSAKLSYIIYIYRKNFEQLFGANQNKH